MGVGWECFGRLPHFQELGLNIPKLDTPCKAGARSTLYVLDRTVPSSYPQTPGYVTGEPRTSHGVRFEFVARLGRTPAKYECYVNGRFFQVVKKKNAPNGFQKKVQNGSPSVPLLSLKARF